MNALFAVSIAEWVVVGAALSVFAAAIMAIRKKKKGEALGSGDCGASSAVLASSDCDSGDSGDCSGGDGGGDGGGD